MSRQKALRQMPAQAGRAGEARGEAASEPASDEAGGPQREPNDTGDPHAALLHAALTRDGATPSLMTSTFRTARYGPACRVVWEGSGQQWSAPIPIGRVKGVEESHQRPQAVVELGREPHEPRLPEGVVQCPGTGFAAGHPPATSPRQLNRPYAEPHVRWCERGLRGDPHPTRCQARAGVATSVAGSLNTHRAVPASGHSPLTAGSGFALMGLRVSGRASGPRPVRSPNG